MSNSEKEIYNCLLKVYEKHISCDTKWLIDNVLPVLIKYCETPSRIFDKD